MDGHILASAVGTVLVEEMDNYGGGSVGFDVKWSHLAGVASVLLRQKHGCWLKPTVMGNSEVTVDICSTRNLAPEADVALEVFVQIGHAATGQPPVIPCQELRTRGGPEFAGHQVRTRLGLYL